MLLLRTFFEHTKSSFRAKKYISFYLFIPAVVYPLKKTYSDPEALEGMELTIVYVLIKKKNATSSNQHRMYVVMLLYNVFSPS